MRALPKPPLVRPRASDLATQPEAAPPAIDVTGLGGKREIGDLRVPREIARVIDEALPEVLQLDEDRIALCALPIQFHCIVKGTRYVALLYVGEGYEELTYLSWFLFIQITSSEYRFSREDLNEYVSSRRNRRKSPLTIKCR